MRRGFAALRRTAVVGLIWGVLWAAMAVLGGTVVGIVDLAQIEPGEEPIVLAPVIGLAGFVCGTIFSSLLWVARSAEARWKIPTQPFVWGMVTGAALPLVMGKGIPEMFVTVPLGAVSAVTSVLIAEKWLALRREHGPSRRVFGGSAP